MEPILGHGGQQPRRTRAMPVSEASHTLSPGKSRSGVRRLSRRYTFNSDMDATYYDILRVNRRAAPEGVRTAYRRLAQKYHPDKLPGNADAERVMAMLNEAYTVLSDPDRRASYDRRIADARAYALRARQRGMTPIDTPTDAWPWYLLFATMAFAFAAIGTVLYKSFVPAVAVPAITSTVAAAPPPASAKPLRR